MNYLIQNVSIEIEISDQVFKPSQHGSSALGNSIRVNPDETVIDIGTGTGLLAILAAKLGGKVSATDILPQAVELAKINVSKNNVSVDVKIGNLFEPYIGEKFDVVIANIPQENLSPKAQEALAKEEVIGMHGGNNGNELLLKVLRSAKDFMHKESRLYVVVYSMSDFRTSLVEIVKNYNAKLINFYTGQVKDFVYTDLDWYLDKSKSGNIQIYKKDSEYWADLFVFELRLLSK